MGKKILLKEWIGRNSEPTPVFVDWDAVVTAKPWVLKAQIDMYEDVPLTELRYAPDSIGPEDRSEGYVDVVEGFEAVCELGEGVDTRIDPIALMATIDACFLCAKDVRKPATLIASQEFEEMRDAGRMGEAALWLAASTAIARMEADVAQRPKEPRLADVLHLVDVCYDSAKAGGVGAIEIAEVQVRQGEKEGHQVIVDAWSRVIEVLKATGTEIGHG